MGGGGEEEGERGGERERGEMGGGIYCKRSGKVWAGVRRMQE